MEDVRTYRIEEDEKTKRRDDERREVAAAKDREDEVPFHIPRD